MWKNRNVWIVLSGEFIADLGLWTSTIANLDFMQKHVPSDFVKSLILLIGLLAGVLVGPLAGRVIDAHRKKNVLVYSGILRLLSVFIMFLALYYDSIGWMILFMIGIQIAATFYLPALQSLLPRIVPEEELMSLNGVFMNVTTVARILGTALAGIMLSVMSLSSLYIASMAAYAFLLAATFFIRIDESLPKESHSAGKSKGGKSGGFKEVIPVMTRLPNVLMILFLTIIPSLFIGGFNLMVISVSELQHDVQIKGLLYTVEGISFILGAFLVKRVSEQRNLPRLLILFSFLIAFAHLSLFFGNVKWSSLLSFGMFGFGAGCFYPLVATFFQTSVPEDYHGRFFSFRNMLDRVLVQIVLLGTGFFLDTIGLRYLAVVFGSISLSLTLIAVIVNRRKQAAAVCRTEAQSG